MEITPFILTLNLHKNIAKILTTIFEQEKIQEVLNNLNLAYKDSNVEKIKFHSCELQEFADSCNEKQQLEYLQEGHKELDKSNFMDLKELTEHIFEPFALLECHVDGNEKFDIEYCKKYIADTTSSIEESNEFKICIKSLQS